MAGRASLSFLGQEDISLSGDPQVTYFVERYAGQTQFAQRVDQVIFDEQSVTFGSENHRILPRKGDLITNMYMLVQFPNIGTVLDSVGTLMFQYVELYIGYELVERLYGEYIEMTYDLTIPKGKQPALKFLTGKTLQFQNVPLGSYYVPLPFSLFDKGLPLCAIKDDVTFRIVWNPSTFFTQPPVQYTGTFTATLSIEYTYISEAEIRFIKGIGQTPPGSGLGAAPQAGQVPQVPQGPQGPQGSLQGQSGQGPMAPGPGPRIFEQVQRNEFFIPQGVSNVQCILNFYNPVKELFFVLQQDSARGYDYSNTATDSARSGTIGTTDLLNALQLNFNTTDRIEPRVGTPQFLRIIQPLEFHTRVPDRLFYMYSFSLDPEGDSPTGSVNLSIIKNQILYLSLNPTQTNVNVRVYAVSYNFLEPSGRVTFSNFF